jgi:hypothetical protein
MTVQLSKPRAHTQDLDTLVDAIMAQQAHGPLAEDLTRWRADLQARLQRVQQHPEQNLGFIEEHIRQSALELQRLLVQQAMQQKADAVAEHCPDCQHPLCDKKRRVQRIVDAYCGKVKLQRTHGWCPACEQWCFPADRVLGLRDDSTASPLVQELCALLVSKMPAEQAEALSLRVTGRALSRSTMARQAQYQGDVAIAVRQKLVEGPVVAAPPAPAGPGVEAPPSPFTLVIQIDAWNIRERDHWGQTQARRRRQEELNRWHWVYTATCFHLEQRCRKGKHKNKQRALITERSYVATRGGVEALMQQLYYEARARGLAQAQRVLVIADGAVWIWNLVADRFGEAIQRLDLFPANTYLWAVAHELHGAGSAQARAWVKPLLRQIRHDQVADVITQLTDLQPRLEAAAVKAAGAAIEYYQNNQSRMKYKEARRRHEPVGSGAIESTCRQLQCRMKRCGQFWSTRGDEALLCLEMFWRNDRWELLFPHARLTSVSNN